MSNGIRGEDKKHWCVFRTSIQAFGRFGWAFIAWAPAASRWARGVLRRKRGSAHQPSGSSAAQSDASWGNGGPRAWRCAKRSRLLGTSSVAGGRTTACRTRRPPQTQASPPPGPARSSNTRQSKIGPAQPTRLALCGFLGQPFSGFGSGGSGITWFRRRCLGSSTPWYGTPLFRWGGTRTANFCANTVR